MKLKGQNHELRLKTLQRQVTLNQPFFNSMLQRPDFAALFGQRVEFLQQQVAQQQNKVIGRYGTNPSPGSLPANTGPMLGNMEG
jgi:hypothetical protein